MERDPRSFLWDARESADSILRFSAGRTADDYLSGAMLRAAVERHFEIIGETLNRLTKAGPDIAAHPSPWPRGGIPQPAHPRLCERGRRNGLAYNAGGSSGT